MHDIGCHTEHQIKRTVLHIPFSHSAPPPAQHWPKPPVFYVMDIILIWAMSILSHGLLYIWRLYFFLPFLSPHFHIESLYGDATDKPLLDCCACGTAKYRVTFYGNWSEKIHPKDYPRKHKLLGSYHLRYFTTYNLIRKTFAGKTLTSFVGTSSEAFSRLQCNSALFFFHGATLHCFTIVSAVYFQLISQT